MINNKCYFFIYSGIRGDDMKNLLVAKASVNIMVTAVLGVIIILQVFIICACAIHNRKTVIQKAEKVTSQKEGS